MSIEINKIYCEDCLVGMQKIPDKTIDIILQDPPYNLTACDFEWDIMTKIDKFWAEWKRIVKDNGAIVMTASQPFTSKLVMSNLKMFKYEWVWDKCFGTNFVQSKFRPLKRHESIIVFSNGALSYNPQKIFLKKTDSLRKSRLQKRVTPGVASKWQIDFNPETQYRNSDVYKFPESILMFRGVSGNNQFNKEKQLHPTQKPVELFEYLIKTYTNEGNVVFDGFLGSGTTAIACINTNRNYIGFEIDEHFYNIAQQRIKDAKAQLKLF